MYKRQAYSPSGRDLTKTIRDYCMEDLDDYILGLTPTVDYYDQTILKYGAKSMDSHNSNWDESPQLVMGNQDYSLCNNFTIARGRDISCLLYTSARRRRCRRWCRRRGCRKHRDHRRKCCCSRRG